MTDQEVREVWERETMEGWKWFCGEAPPLSGCWAFQAECGLDLKEIPKRIRARRPSKIRIDQKDKTLHFDPWYMKHFGAVSAESVTYLPGEAFLWLMETTEPAALDLTREWIEPAKEEGVILDGSEEDPVALAHEARNKAALAKRLKQGGGVPSLGLVE